MKEVSRFAIKDPPQVFLDDTMKATEKFRQEFEGNGDKEA